MALIKECSACKKRGLFLKLNNGLCLDCLNELKFLEHQYYYLESIIKDNIIVSDPNKVIEKANLILRKFDKFKNASTPISRDLCLEVISIMENQYNENTDSEEPISITPDFYKEQSIDSSEVILETLTKDDLDDLSQFENITIDNDESQKSTQVFDENLEEYSSTDETLPQSIIEEPIITECNKTNESILDISQEEVEDSKS